MTYRLAAALAVILTGSIVATAAADDPVLIVREVYLMGTRASLSTIAPNRGDGLGTLESAVRALEASEHQLSTWIEDSPISRLNRQPLGTPWSADAALCQMFDAVYAWHRATGGAFDPGVGRLVAAWDIHGDGRVPGTAELEAALDVSGLGNLEFDRSRCTLTRRAGLLLDVGAFGKGEALDRAAEGLGSTPWMIDLGGQVSVGGLRARDIPWTVAVAHPIDRQHPYLTVTMREGSLSTTAGSERDLIVNGTRVGHVLDPRTGRPAPFHGSVTVWHESGLAADALSTALYVMGPDAGLAWAEGRGLSVCYLIPDERGSVRMRTTTAFQRLLGP